MVALVVLHFLARQHVLRLFVSVLYEGRDPVCKTLLWRDDILGEPGLRRNVLDEHGGSLAHHARLSVVHCVNVR